MAVILIKIMVYFAVSNGDLYLLWEGLQNVLKMGVFFARNCVLKVIEP